MITKKDGISKDNINEQKQLYEVLQSFNLYCTVLAQQLAVGSVSKGAQNDVEFS